MFGNVKKKIYGGKQYDSMFEASVAQELDLRVKAGEVTNWDRQVRISLEVNGYKVCDYYVDFVAYLSDGTTEYIEAKGFSTPAFKLKWKLFEALYSTMPNTKLTLIFQGKSWKPRLKRIG